MHLCDMKDMIKTTASSNACVSVPKDLLVKLSSTDTSYSLEEVKENQAFTKKFMEDHVYNVYERIAEHFSHTRYRPWPGVVDFLKNLELGSIVLDVGCGNAKYAFCNSSIVWIGVDRSQNLMKHNIQHLALHTKQETFKTDRKRSPELNVNDCENLSFRSEIADACISIAVLHHLPTEKQRIDAVHELIRCTRSGGQILIYVWSTDHKYQSIGSRVFESPDVFVPWKLQRQFDPVYTTSTALDSETPKIKRKNPLCSTTTLHRYYHLFSLEEIQALFLKITTAAVVSIVFDSNNWKILLKKN